MFQFIRIGNTNLVCFNNGTILRFWKQTKKWNVCGMCETENKKGFLQMKIDGKQYACHRVIAHAFKILDLNSPLLIDHIDRDGKNNCRSNLRPVTPQQNNFNTNAKGYSFEKQTRKWKSSICLDEKRITIGRYDTEEEAKEAYLNAKQEYHKF